MNKPRNGCASFEELHARLRPVYEELEGKRKEIVGKKVKTAAVSSAVAFAAMALSLLIFAGMAGGSILVTSLIFSAIVGACIIFAPSAEYSFLYKSQVIAPFVKEIIEEGEYDPGSGVSRQVFAECGLFERPDRYNCEDSVSGKIGLTDIHFSEVHAEKRHTTTDSKGRTKEHWTDIFRGFMFVADFNKHFAGQTIVVRGRGWRGRLKRVRLEDPLFEKKYKTYSTDQVEARYILTPNLMERMLALDKVFSKGKITYSFSRSSIIIAIASSVDHFETSLWKRPDEESVLRREFDLLCTFVNMVEELNLNTRIWTKE